MFKSLDIGMTRHIMREEYQECKQWLIDSGYKYFVVFIDIGIRLATRRCIKLREAIDIIFSVLPPLDAVDYTTLSVSIYEPLMMIGRSKDRQRVYLLMEKVVDDIPSVVIASDAASIRKLNVISSRYVKDSKRKIIEQHTYENVECGEPIFNGG